MSSVGGAMGVRAGEAMGVRAGGVRMPHAGAPASHAGTHAGVLKKPSEGSAGSA